MKLIARTLTSLLLSVVYLGGIAYGQSSAAVVKVNIPFEFNVGDKSFAAGDYSLVQPMQHFLVLRDSRGKTVASAFTSGMDVSTPVATPKLRFTSVDGQQVLTELWPAQDRAGQRLVSSKSRATFAKRHSQEAREAAEGSQP